MSITKSTILRNTPILFVNNNKNHNLSLVTVYIEQILINFYPNIDAKKITDQINKQQYSDFIQLNGTIIGKDEIKELQHHAMFSSQSELGLKFYFIENLDKTNKYIMNSLLKFIEEPPKNVFIFFSCTNSNDILETIKSRCHIINATSSINKSKEHNSVIGVVNLYNSIFYLSDVNKFIDQFKKLNYNEINEFLNEILGHNKIEQTYKIYELLNDVKLNINKNLIIFKLLKMKGF